MSKTAQELLEERKKRVLDAVALKVPDRVPMFVPCCAVGAEWAGITVKEGFTDMARWADINEKLMLEFEPDMFIGLYAFDIESNEMVGTKNYNWPGNGLPDTSSAQFHEGEYMKAEEYDAFIDNPGDFIFRKYLPRVYGKLEGLNYMPPFMSLLSYGGLFQGFSNPAVLDSLQTIINAAKCSFNNFMHVISFTSRMVNHGFPALIGFGSHAPFDVISDYLRGLKGSSLDLFRCPEKILAVQEKLMPYLIESSVYFGKMMGTPITFIALHRGSDAFMS